MPRFTATSAEDTMEQHKLAGNFGFSATKIDNLGSSYYTLATIAIDVTGSVDDFKDLLLKMLILAIEGCKKAPTRDAVLVRVVIFNSSIGVQELHGFMPVDDIDLATYKGFSPRGLTPLCDAVYSSMAATNDYAEKLRSRHYSCNAIFFVITDGEENDSKMKMPQVKAELRKAKTDEKLESVMSILIGVGTDQGAMSALAKFQKEAGMDHFIPAGDATDSKLAKVAGFISKSVSSTSQKVAGGPTPPPIDPTI